jgi:hypothetical protein
MDKIKLSEYEAKWFDRVEKFYTMSGNEWK